MGFVRASDELIPAMESALQGGGRLFVHCQQGRSRSCSLVVAYLMRCKGYSARRAMELVAACRPEMELNEAYAKVLLGWEVGADAAVPLLEELSQEHPRWFRRGGVARLHAEEEVVAMSCT